MGVGQYAITYSVTATPVMRGSIMSSVITSGRSDWHNSMARWPSGASPTTSRPGSPPSTSTRRLRTVNESSTTRTRIFVMSPYQPTNRLQQLCLIKFTFHHVGQRASFFAALFILRRIAGRDQDGRHIRKRGSRVGPSHEFEAVHARHFHVYHEQVIVLGAGFLQRLFGGGCQMHLITGGLQDALFQHARGQGIIDDQNNRHSWRRFRDGACALSAGSKNQRSGV